jgi:hypothetical protein
MPLFNIGLLADVTRQAIGAADRLGDREIAAKNANLWQRVLAGHSEPVPELAEADSIAGVLDRLSAVIHQKAGALEGLFSDNAQFFVRKPLVSCWLVQGLPGLGSLLAALHERNLDLHGFSPQWTTVAQDGDRFWCTQYLSISFNQNDNRIPTRVRCVLAPSGNRLLIEAVCIDTTEAGRRALSDSFEHVGSKLRYGIPHFGTPLLTVGELARD